MELTAEGIVTIRQAISTVRESLRSVNIDDRISNRQIYSILSGYANTFIEQDNRRRELFSQAYLFKTIECFELQDANLNDTCDIFLVSCTRIAKSKVKIPKFYATNNGTLLSVTSVFGDRQYNYIEPSAYKDYKNREFKSKGTGVYWVDNEYLIIPDEFVESVRLRGIFINENEVNALNGITNTGCRGIMDQTFIVPKHLLGNVLKYTIADTRNITVPLQEDAVPNMNQAERQVTIDQE